VLSSPVRRGTPVAAFCAGLLAGGVLTAAALLVLGGLVPAPLPVPARAGAALAALAAVLLVDRGALRWPVPQNRRLIPESVLRHGRHLGPLQFGLEMGTGARTFLPTPLPYAAAITVLLLAPAPAALLTGLGFGAGRALMTLGTLRYGPDADWNHRWTTRARPLGITLDLAVALGVVALAVVAPAAPGW
jgi:ABC-type Na+ efflux pump permease subunit